MRSHPKKLYILENTRFFLEDLRAVKRGEYLESSLTRLYLYLDGQPQPVSAHIDKAQVDPFLADWETHRNGGAPPIRNE